MLVHGKWPRCSEWENREPAENFIKMDAPTKMEFDVEITCGNCVRNIEQALKAKEGIKKWTIDQASGQVLVESTLSTEKVKSIIESTGKRAVLKGLGGAKGHLGAAVSIMEVGSHLTRGLIRMVQTDPDKLVVDGTIDGLRPGRHALCVHECGDISDGCASCGDILGLEKTKQAPVGVFGDIEAGPDGRAEFRFIQDRMKVWEMIGRSMIVHQCSSDQLLKDNSPQKRVTCGIVARSAGLFENSKRICACDGVTQWDERNVPTAGAGRQANL